MRLWMKIAMRAACGSAGNIEICRRIGNANTPGRS
jgi:hypothetical protein